MDIEYKVRSGLAVFAHHLFDTFKGTPITKALTCMKTYLYKQKMAILSRRPIPILLYEQFLHLTQINLHPNTQLLSTQQHAYQSFFGYFLVWFRLRHCDLPNEF